MKLDDVNAVLARYPASARPLSPPEALGNAGGSSGSLFWRLSSGKGTLVVRAWPVNGPGRETLRRIHGWLLTIRDLGFVAIPERDREGETIQEHAGRLWDVVPWMPGAADVSQPPAPARLRAGFIALASFHQALAHTGGDGHSPGLAARLAELDHLVGGGFDAMRVAIESAPTDVRRDTALRWIDLARQLTPAAIVRIRRASARRYRLQACLRDARPDHFLFEGDRLTGLIDFGAMGVDAVAGDLARLLTEWVGTDRVARARALDAYASIRPLDDSESALIEAFETSSVLLSGGHWIRWHFLEGQVFEDPEAVDKGLTRGLDRLARLAVS
jgi:Ser/Thr protein kinase RdoA (MazF antagonist)